MLDGWVQLALNNAHKGCLEITVEMNVSVRTMDTVILWMAHAFAQVATMEICVMKHVKMVHMGHTALRYASVKMMLFAQFWMVFVLVNLDGMVCTASHSVSLDTMVISAIKSVCA
jgi:hypothetical protein